MDIRCTPNTLGRIALSALHPLEHVLVFWSWVLCSLLILLVYYIGTLLLEGKSRGGEESLETGIVFFSVVYSVLVPTCFSSSTVLTRETTSESQFKATPLL